MDAKQWEGEARSLLGVLGDFINSQLYDGDEAAEFAGSLAKRAAKLISEKSEPLTVVMEPADPATNASDAPINRPAPGKTWD